MPILTALLSGTGRKFLLLGAGVLAILAGLLYVEHLRSEVATIPAIKAQVATLAAANAADEEELAAAKAQALQAQQADAAAQKVVQTDAVTAATVRAEIHQTAPGGPQDGTVAPVLLDTIKELHDAAAP